LYPPLYFKCDKIIITTKIQRTLNHTYIT